MDIWTFGLTLALSGMAGTLLVLWCVSLLIGVLKKVFPPSTRGSRLEARRLA